MGQVFISYKREDKERIAPIVEALRQGGIDTWWDQDIPAGAAWRATIVAKLDSAALCLVAWSHDSVGEAGRYVREEAERATRRGAYFGVLLDPVMPPFGFGEWQAVDLSAWRGKAGDPLLDFLVATVQARLDGAIAPPPPRTRRRLPPALIRLGAASLVLMMIGSGYWAGLFRPGESGAPPNPTDFVNERLATIDCAWAEISGVRSGEGGQRIALSGIAASPESLQTVLMRDATARGLAIAEVAVEDVATAPPDTCAELQLLRSYRWAGRSRLSIIAPHGPPLRTPHGLMQCFEWELDFTTLARHAALLGLDNIRGVHVVQADLQDYRRRYAPRRTRGTVATYRACLIAREPSERNLGLLLMTANAPIDRDLVEAIGTQASRTFLERLETTAREREWTFELGLVRCGFEYGPGRQC